MGVDVFQIGSNSGQESIVPAGPEISLNQKELPKPQFHSFHVPNPDMHIWLMTTKPGERVFPNATFQAMADEDLQNLQKFWSVGNEQALFDSLFLSQFMKISKTKLYAIFSGNIRNVGWKSLKDADRSLFSKGQSCIYRLDASYDGKLNVNWVPFFSAQSLVKDPDFGSLWRLFQAGAGEPRSHSLCMFSLSEPRLLPDVIALLINKEPERSQKLSEMVEWFGVYSSPSEPNLGSCALVYSKKREIVAALETLQEHFLNIVTQTQKELVEDVRPRVAIRVVSRHVVL